MPEQSVAPLPVVIEDCSFPVVITPVVGALAAQARDPGFDKSGVTQTEIDHGLLKS